VGKILRLAVCMTLCGWMAGPSPAVEIEPLLAKLRAVGDFGQGNREAAAAWATIVTVDADRLPVLLAGLDGANPLAANWIGTAIEAVAQRQRRQGEPLPADALEAFVRQPRHSPRARRLAYELLLEVDPRAEGRLVDGFLDDPGLEFRRDAVEHVIGQARKLAGQGKPAEALARYRRAFDAARDPDQISRLAATLRKLGEKVDLAGHYGFLLHWQVIGPFDNSGERGYDVAYPPEQEIHLDAQYQGKHGTVRWIDHRTDDPLGKVDFNKLLGKEKDVLGYALATFDSTTQQKVQFRTTSFNAVKVWLNGKLIDEHNIYHGGSQLDQYAATATLKPGRNSILVKVCQNAQTQDWADVWGFQLRVCDEIGGAVRSKMED